MPGARSSLMLAAGAFGTGVLLGVGRLVKTYDWRTRWLIAAPRPVVYRAVTDPAAAGQWWPVMEQVWHSPGDLREGSVAELRVHQAPAVARLAPPFRLRCVYTHVEADRRLRQIVTGDLVGVLDLHLDDSLEGTSVTFDWYVRVGNPLLGLLGHLLAPAYRHSHDFVMQAGEQGLRDYCSRRSG